MFASWLVYVLIAVPLVTAGAMATPKGKQWVKKQHRRLRQRTWRITRETVHDKRQATAKGRAKAATRANRRAQPRNWLAGRKRTTDDPRVPVKVARAVAGKTKGKTVGHHPVKASAGWVSHHTADLFGHLRLWWLNRQPRQRTGKQTWNEIMHQRAEAARSAGICGWKDTTTGHDCENPRMVGGRWCQVHERGNVIA
jgi:hypothetical protein